MSSVLNWNMNFHIYMECLPLYFCRPSWFIKWHQSLFMPSLYTKCFQYPIILFLITKFGLQNFRERFPDKKIFSSVKELFEGHSSLDTFFFSFYLWSHMHFLLFAYIYIMQFIHSLSYLYFHFMSVLAVFFLFHSVEILWASWGS